MFADCIKVEVHKCASSGGCVECEIYTRVDGEDFNFKTNLPRDDFSPLFTRMAEEARRRIVAHFAEKDKKHDRP